MNPPAAIPVANARFQRPVLRQSYRRKPGFFESGTGSAAQAWRRFAETPNTFPPNKRRAGTMRPMRGPAIYQGHGWTGSIVIGRSGYGGKNTTCSGIQCGFASSSHCLGLAKPPYKNLQRPRPGATRTHPNTFALWLAAGSLVAVAKASALLRVTGPGVPGLCLLVCGRLRRVDERWPN